MSPCPLHQFTQELEEGPLLLLEGAKASLIGQHFWMSAELWMHRLVHHPGRRILPAGCHRERLFENTLRLSWQLLALPGPEARCLDTEALALHGRRGPLGFAVATFRERCPHTTYGGLEDEVRQVRQVVAGVLLRTRGEKRVEGLAIVREGRLRVNRCHERELIEEREEPIPGRRIGATMEVQHVGWAHDEDGTGRIHGPAEAVE